MAETRTTLFLACFAALIGGDGVSDVVVSSGDPGVDPVAVEDGDPVLESGFEGIF